MQWVSMSIRLRALGTGLAAILAGTMSVASAELKDPLSPLTSAKGSILCFRRDYSPVHLAQHPKQMIKSVLLAFQQGFVTVELNSAQRRAEADWSRLRLVGGSGDRYLRPQDDPQL